jgi:hypothetical protein
MNVGVRYGFAVGSVAFLFGNFIACGAQMYRVSLKDDHNAAQVSIEATDPNSPAFGLHSPHGWVKLPIEFKVGNSMDPEQKSGLLAAMKTWEIATGKTLFKYIGVQDGVDGDSFPDLYSSLKDAVNGQYLDANWKKTGKPDVVLATTIWNNSTHDSAAISTADIRFNVQDYVLGNSQTLKGAYVEATGQFKDPVDMQTLALHELGHLLGLAHVSSDMDAVSIMNPYVYIGEGLTNRHVSTGDIERIQKIYGCEGAVCDVDKALDAVLEFSKTDPTQTAAH